MNSKHLLSLYFKVFLYMSGIIFIGMEGGTYFSFFGNIIGVFFIFIYIIVLFKESKAHKKAYVMAAQFLILILSVGILPDYINTVPLILIPWLYYRSVAYTEIFSGSVLVGYILAKNFIPHFFILEKWFADIINFLFAAILKTPLNFSPSAYGLSILLTLLSIVFFNSMYQTSDIDGEKDLKFKRIMYFLIHITTVLISFFIFYLIYFKFSSWYLTLKAFNAQEYKQMLYYIAGMFLPMNGQYIFFIFSFILVLAVNVVLLKANVFIPFIGLRLQNSSITSMGIYIVFLTIIISFASFNVDIGYDASKSKPTVHIYDTKMDFKTVPDDKVYGSKNGLFGLLPKYLSDMGYTMGLYDSWEKINPQRHDVLIIINPSGKMDGAEKKRMLDFMEKGGRILFLGDHTYMFGLENDYFDFVKELGIKFNFDTAIYTKPLWRGCIRSPYMTWDDIFKKEWFNAEILQGASLTVNFPAVPFIIGEYAWSDEGNLANKPGFLGDRIYSPKEPLGDVVLAAERNYGKGKLMVFGDTTFTQNSPISSTYPFIKLCLHHLMPQEYFTVKFLIPLTFFVLAAFLMLFMPKVGMKNAGVAVLVLFVAVLGVMDFCCGSNAYFGIETNKEQSVGIDGHFYPEYYRVDWGNKDRGIGGLKNTIVRAGATPYIVYDYNNFPESLKFLVITAPKMSISQEDARKIVEFSQNGGTVVLSCGLEHRNNVLELLSMIDADIESFPLSYLEGDATQNKLRFASAWPVSGGQNTNVNVLCKTKEGKPIIIEIKKDKGRFILIGDSYFFENRNLEQNENYYIYNMEFVKKLFSKGE